MVTKTLTITEDAYTLLKGHKLENESFSQEIVRVFSKKKTLKDYFGILTKEEGKGMIEDLMKIKKRNIALLNKRVKEQLS